MSEEKDFRVYSATFVSVFVALFLYVFLVNVFYDPWWHFAGNVTGGPKYTVTDRESKIAHFNNSSSSYDCVILGSSRLLTLDQTTITGHSCYNFSISGGQIQTMLGYASYFKKRFPNPKLVLIGLDDHHFYRKGSSCRLPSAGLKQLEPQAPAPWWKTYLSPYMMRYAKRINDHHRVAVGYDSQWRPLLNPTLQEKVYQFRWNRVGKTIANNKGKDLPQKYFDDCLPLLENFRELFPDATIAGFVPPVAANLIVTKHAAHELDAYLAVMVKAARYFDSFIDLGLPSPLTLNPTLTWDGSHFKPEVSAQLSEAIFGRSTSLGLDFKAMTLKQIRDSYHQAVQQLIEKHGLTATNL